VIAVAMLAFVLISVFVKGVGALNLDFLTKAAAPFGEPGGGIADAIVGSAIIVAIAALIAVPIGVLVAIYTTEFASARSSFAVRSAAVAGGRWSRSSSPPRSAGC